MNDAIQIHGITINVDADNRYSLTDLYNAAKKMGLADESDRPTDWLRTKTAQKYVDFLEINGVNSHFGVGIQPIEIIKGGEFSGTYAVKDLVYSYAIWLSVEFHHEVIQTYDKKVTEEHAQLEELQAKLKTSIPKDPNCISSVIGGSPLEAHKFFKKMEVLDLVRIEIDYKPVYKKFITEKGWAYLQGYSKDGIVRVEPEMHNALMALVANFGKGNQIDMFGSLKE
jgi:hypothetical protein